MLRNMMQFPVEKFGDTKSNTQNMLSREMQYLVKKSGVKNQLRKAC